MKSKNKMSNSPKRLKLKTGKCYDRTEAAQFLGFPRSKDLTDWLILHHLMNKEAKPANYLVKRGLMKFVTKKIYLGPRYLTAFRRSNIYIPNTGCPTKNVNVPLFTNKGISYFKWLVRDSEQPEKVKEVIQKATKPAIEKNNYLLVKKYISEHNI